VELDELSVCRLTQGTHRDPAAKGVGGVGARSAIRLRTRQPIENELGPAMPVFALETGPVVESWRVGQ